VWHSLKAQKEAHRKENQVMEKRAELHVVFGATGDSGSAVIRELLRQGKRVRAVNRSGKAKLPPAVEVVQADAADPASARMAAAGATVIYHCAGVPLPQWTTHLRPILDGILEAAATSEAKLVVVDNVYMYGKAVGPVTETNPSQPVGPIGRLRADMVEMLLQAHQRGKVRVAIGRAADFYGPGVRAAIANEALFRRALDGKSVNWPGRLDVPHSLMFVDDLARSLIVLGEREEALGQIWHLPHAPVLTPRQFLLLLFEEARQAHSRIRSLPSWAIRAVGLVDPTARAFAELRYLFEAPFIMDSSRYQQIFEGEATSYREGIRQTLTSFGFQ